MTPRTADDIVDRAAARDEEPPRLFVWGIGWLAAGLILCVLALFQPIHDWLHAHLQFLCGVVVGSLLQVPGWLYDRWLWLKWFSWQ